MHPATARLFALATASALVFAAFGPASIAGVAAAGNAPLSGAGNLAIGVQHGTNVTVSVTHNGSAVPNASVEVTTDGDYAGTGSYMTDESGTLALSRPAPNTTVSVTITATKPTDSGTLEGSTTATLRGKAGQGPDFVTPGQRVAAFVHSLTRTGGIGPLIAGFIHSTAPVGPPPGIGPPAFAGAGNPGPPGGVGPAHAGPADRGPPAHAGPPGTGTATAGNHTHESGPPAHAGPQGADEDEGNETSAESSDHGPPDHANGGDDDADGTQTDENSDDDSGNHGPPDHAKGKD